jgi:hypothetical protein
VPLEEASFTVNDWQFRYESPRVVLTRHCEFEAVSRLVLNRDRDTH